MTYRECYIQGQRLLTEAGIAEAALDARLLLEHVCGTNRNDLLVHGDKEVVSEHYETYQKLLQQRAQRSPLQHITGVQEFMGLEFTVNDKVLIPRQDTEILVEEVLRELQSGMRILDVCTGSGCILLSILHYSNDCTGVGVDISPEALAVAGRNGDALSRERELEYTFLEGDLFAPVEGKFDIIVSNPPYIATAVIETLEPEVRDHEPMLALDGKEDGLFFYRRLAAECGAYLNRGGRLYLEIGYDQGQAVQELLTAAGFGEVQVVQDYAGLDRVVHGIYFGMNN